MLDLDVPANVAREVLARWPVRGSEWRGTAPAKILELCERHSVVPVHVFPARFSLVVAATGAGHSIVVRSTPDPYGPQQAIVARALAAVGIGPQVHEVTTSSATTCVVMDVVEPGTVARDCGVADVADLLRPLVATPASPSELSPVSAWIRNRLIGDELGRDMYLGATPPADAERDRGLRLLDYLVEGEASSVCHGDVSLGNVLRGRDQLYLIDPRGMTGDVEYDAAVAAIKAGLDFRELARRLEIDAARTEAWVQVAISARV